MITQPVTDVIDVIDTTGLLKEAVTLCNTIYPDYNDSELQDVLLNPYISGSQLYASIRDRLDSDIIQFLNMFGIFLTTETTFEINMKMVWMLLNLHDRTNDNALEVFEYIYDDDPERSVAEMSNFVSSDYTVEDYLSAIDYVDPYSMEKLVNNLNERMDEQEAVPISTKILSRLRQFSKAYPDNIAMSYLNHGGVMGSSSDFYFNLFESEIMDERDQSDTTQSRAVNVFSVFLLTGQDMRLAERSAIRYVNEHLDLAVGEIEDIVGYIKQIGGVV